MRKNFFKKLSVTFFLLIEEKYTMEDFCLKILYFWIFVEKYLRAGSEIKLFILFKYFELLLKKFTYNFESNISDTLFT